MYEPVFNSVLVLIDDKEAEWGSGNDESMLGKSFSKGKVVRVGDFHAVPEHPEFNPIEAMEKLTGKEIIWNEGTEAGTIFEFDGKQFGMIYWWDIRGVLVNQEEK